MPSVEALTRNQFSATTRLNKPLCREHYLLSLGLDAFPPTQPGQFIQISCRDTDEGYYVDAELCWDETHHADGPIAPEFAGPLALLRRPFSLAGRRDTDSGVELEIIHRVVGVGTNWLSRLKPGDNVDILGPLGNRFTLPP